MGDRQIIELRDTIGVDDSITNLEHHTYNPYTTSFDNNNEIRITIQQQDLYVWPHDSYIYIEGVVQKTPANDDHVMPSLINNGIAFLFDEIRYEINGFTVDSCKNVGTTTTMKGYLSHRPNDMNQLAITGWNLGPFVNLENDKAFNFIIPLKNILGFAEDYQNIIMNVKHELILNRSRTDVNAMIGDFNNCKLKLLKVQWRVPHVIAADAEKLKLMKIIDRKQTIPLYFRSWELYDYPVLPRTNRQIWAVKTSTHLNTPRYIILGFQHNRNNVMNADMSVFDHCKFNDLKVYLNSECYPYENLDIDFSTKQYAVLYDMYCRFQKSYHHDRHSSTAAPLLTFNEFKTRAPFIVIDCTHQNETLKKSVVDIRLVFQTKENFAPDTTAFCLIIHDNIVTYNPYTNIMNRAF